MRFVLKEKIPGFLLTIKFSFDFDGTRVDFIRNHQVIQFTGFVEITRAYRRQIHKGNGFGLSAEEFSFFKIIVENAFQRLFKCAAELNICKFGLKSGVTAVVAPVGIKNFQLGLRWISVFRLEIVLNKPKVIQAKGETVVFVEIFQFLC